MKTRPYWNLICTFLLSDTWKKRLFVLLGSLEMMRKWLKIAKRQKWSLIQKKIQKMALYKEKRDMQALLLAATCLFVFASAVSMPRFAFPFAFAFAIFVFIFGSFILLSSVFLSMSGAFVPVSRLFALLLSALHLRLVCLCLCLGCLFFCLCHLCLVCLYL